MRHIVNLLRFSTPHGPTERNSFFFIWPCFEVNIVKMDTTEQFLATLCSHSLGDFLFYFRTSSHLQATTGPKRLYKDFKTSYNFTQDLHPLKGQSRCMAQLLARLTNLNLCKKCENFQRNHSSHHCSNRMASLCCIWTN